ncbi:hypothetical protein ISN45_At03g012710 [Arabidopsis thaliana x Arabidopsis arenosa]|uniref:Uncharacterized protein n=2 Tax=Arabidopsis TaxID=3701 RepID=A0A8T2F8V3_ARASU|nr:hypothetical protein ISN45_At03g012710 [Arabidopsis thaliana x Arabidopsis arenosa]KAG7631010.1 hypothetical protein ISN44_As03g012760 [Arabidopsis suecica]
MEKGDPPIGCIYTVDLSVFIYSKQRSVFSDSEFQQISRCIQKQKQLESVQMRQELMICLTIYWRQFYHLFRQKMRWQQVFCRNDGVLFGNEL